MNFFEAVFNGRNILLTGGGGVGKSYTIRELIERNKKAHIDFQKLIALTATTGLASLNIHGQTIHKFSGMGTFKSKRDIEKITYLECWADCKRRIEYHDIVIIDEVSMLRSDQFIVLSEIFKYAMESDLPFGGKQMIFTGDFLQLPPVVMPGEDIHGIFPFQTSVWEEMNIHTIYLKEVKRQSDLEFITALNEVRVANVSDKTERYFLQRLNTKPEDREVIALTALNKEADEINQQHLGKISGDVETFIAGRTWNLKYDELYAEDKAEASKLRRKLISHYKNEIDMLHAINIKKGARVIITANNSNEGYVNGHLGTFICSGHVFDINTEKYECLWELFQYDDYAKRYNVYEYTDGKYVIPNEEVYKQLLTYYEKNRTKKLDFTPAFSMIVELDDKRQVAVHRDEYEFFHPDQHEEDTYALKISQFPIKLGWAISIHKSQGQTLKEAYIDPSSIFDNGQFYVALSRVQTIEGLYLKSFPRRLIKAHPDALRFYQQLEQGN